MYVVFRVVVLVLQQRQLVVIVVVWKMVAVVVEAAVVHYLVGIQQARCPLFLCRTLYYDCHGVVTCVDSYYWGCRFDVSVDVGHCGGYLTENGIVYEHDSPVPLAAAVAVDIALVILGSCHACHNFPLLLVHCLAHLSIHYDRHLRDYHVVDPDRGHHCGDADFDLHFDDLIASDPSSSET